MTVGELIARLQRCDPEVEAWVIVDIGGGLGGGIVEDVTCDGPNGDVQLLVT